MVLRFLLNELGHNKRRYDNLIISHQCVRTIYLATHKITLNFFIYEAFFAIKLSSAIPLNQVLIINTNKLSVGRWSRAKQQSGARQRSEVTERGSGAERAGNRETEL